MKPDWRGVYAAMTTAFNRGGGVDAPAVAAQARLLVDAGCRGIVPLGSLGEGATLDREERLTVLTAVVDAVGNRAAVVPGIAALSTAEAVRLAEAARAAGADGLMILPPYAYSTDWREMGAHVAAVLRATPLPAMLYNNPAAYRTDFLPEQIGELATDHANLEAVKESSGDVRRITAIAAQLGERLSLLVGLDDCVVEGVRAGARGWVAGLVNAFPQESVRLFALALQAATALADPPGLRELQRWFLPLLRLDTVPKFVQLIKLAQAETGLGGTAVRPPRLPLAGQELQAARGLIREALAARPPLSPGAF